MEEASPNIDIRRVERIDGIALPLGTMTLDELIAVRGYCDDRLEAARHDGSVVQDYVDRRFPAEETA